MRQSKLFGKTEKTDRVDVSSISHRLLVKGGFIRESVAGRYYFLPLGLRVHQKITNIIKEEMDKAGAQEMVSPILHPLELWQESNRDNAGNFGLMMIEDRRGGKFALGGTAEEMFVDVVRKFQISYKDLPFNIYQFSNKFRDELRARGGLLRVREFVMKDAYSFDRDENDFLHTYKLMSETYENIFSRMGLKANKVLADNGYIGGEYCHEYIVDCEAGESAYLVSEDESYKAHEDVAQVELPHCNPDEPIRDMQTIEQPEWVKDMADNQKHYGEPLWRYLKNVVYKRIDTGEIIIVTIRGDLEVNKAKLEKLVGAIELLEPATDDDLRSIGTKPGFVHAWGLQATYVADNSLKTVTNFIGGQKTESTDTTFVNYGRDFSHPIEADVVLAKPGQINSDVKKISLRRGIEVGNIFQLGTHYTDKMQGATFRDKDGQMKPFYMGCYGIGVGRAMATVVELYNDEKGIKWPESIAPFAVHLVSLQNDDPEIKDWADGLYSTLVSRGVDVLYDDRELRAGEKFADSDLLGIPIRIVAGRKAKEQKKYEVVYRSSGELFYWSEEELLNNLLGG